MEGKNITRMYGNDSTNDDVAQKDPNNPAKNIINQQTAIGADVYLNDDFEIMQTPEGFVGIVLQPHQQTVVKAMYDLEQTKIIRIVSDQFSTLSPDIVTIQSSAMVLSEPLGSGKTIEILALIMHNPIPKAFAEYENYQTIELGTGHRKKRHPRFVTEVVKRVRGKSLLTPTLIIVGASVIIQWKNTIMQIAPKLRVFVISDFYTFVAFKKIFDDGLVNSYNIILLKNGTMTGNFKLESDEREVSARGMVSTMHKMTNNSCWARVVLDDFDTIRIPPDTRVLNALSTIYVSTTRKTSTTPKAVDANHETIEDAFDAKGAPLSTVITDNILFTNFNVHNDSQFTERSTNIPFVNKFQCIYNNPDDNYIRLLGAMGEDEANNIAEALNGDAVKTAAQMMGITTVSVADIFQKVLNNKYDKWRHDKAVLEAIAKVRAIVDDPDLPAYEDNRLHSHQEIDHITSAIKHAKIPKITYFSDRLEPLLDELRAEYMQLAEQDGKAIDRVISNVKEGSCQICTYPLGETDAFILKCCGLIVCDKCGIQGNNIKTQHDYRTKTTTLVGACANCRRPIYPQNDLIFVDKNINIEKLLNVSSSELTDKVDTKKEESTSESESKNPKISALLDIIKNSIPPNRKSLEIEIRGLLNGKKDVQYTGTKPKILLFANYKETLDLVQDELVMNKIEYLKLEGRASEMAATVDAFRKRGVVLLINSQQNCAGLNLQFATHIVLFHHIIDESIISQVCGRAQRIGRTENLQLYWLLYSNETNAVKKR